MFPDPKLWFRKGAPPKSPAGANRPPNNSRSGLTDLLLSQTVAAVASVLVTFITAHFLEPSGRGQVAFVTGTGSLLGAMAFGSVHVGVAHAHKEGDPTALRRGLRLAIFSAASVFILTLAVSCIMFALRHPLAPQLALAAFASSLVCFNLSVLRTRQGLGDARAFRNAAGLQSLVYAVLGTMAAGLAHCARAVIFAWFVGLVTSMYYGLRGYHRDHNDRSLTSSRISTRSIVATSLAAHVGVAGMQALYRADIAILGFIVSERDLGIYSIATPVAEVTWVLSEALSLFAFSQVHAGQTPVERRMQRRRLVFVNFIAGTIGAVFVASATLIALPKVLPDYAAASPLVLILLPGILLQGNSRIAFAALLATGVRRPPIVIGGLSVALALLYLPFSLVWGITGAAVATTIIYILQAGIVYGVIRRNDAHS